MVWEHLQRCRSEIDTILLAYFQGMAISNIVCASYNHLQLQKIGDLKCELISLYQWIHEEDQIIFQEAIHHLLRLLVWCLRLYTIEDTHRGGFRNLLLDSWWLEFWEIILLAAGDVERHPGPTDELLTQVSDRPIGKDDVIHFHHNYYCIIM